MAPEQFDGVHDAAVSQVAHLHEAEHLIDPGLLVVFQGFNHRIGISHGKGAGFDMVFKGLTRAFLLNGTDGELVGIGDVSALPGGIEIFCHVDKPHAFRAAKFEGLFVGFRTVGDTQRGHLIIDKAAHWRGVLDALAVHGHALGHLAVAA